MADKNAEEFRQPPVQDRRLIPPGVLPKNLQAWAFGGLAAVMIAVIALTGSNPPKPKPAPDPVTAAVDPDAARIQEYQKRIEEETRKLQQEQSQLAQTKEPALLSSGGNSPVTSYSRPIPERYPEGERPQANNAIQAEKEKREYLSLFASNVALSLRPEAMVSPAPPSNSVADELAKVLSLNAALAAAPPVPQAATSTSPQGLPSRSEEPSHRTDNGFATPSEKKPAIQGIANDPPGTYRVYEGSVLEAALANRLDGSFSGPVNCVVTTNLYSADGRHLLVPQGSRALGEVHKVESFGQERLAVFFHRLIMPDGYSVNLDAFQGLNQIGETGLRDQVNHHYLQVFGVSLAIGAIAGLGQATARTGSDQTALDNYEQGVTNSLSQSSLHILDRYLNVLPTFTIFEGHRVKVYLSQDLLLPAYDQHHGGKS